MESTWKPRDGRVLGHQDEYLLRSAGMRQVSISIGAWHGFRILGFGDTWERHQVAIFLVAGVQGGSRSRSLPDPSLEVALASVSRKDALGPA